MRFATLRGAPSALPGVLALALLSLPASRPRAQDDPGARYTPDELVAQALAEHPDLAALADRRRALLAESEAARAAWPQPRVAYNAFVLPVETRQGEQRHQLSATQAFPWPGTRGRAAEPARAEARALDAESAARALELELAVRRACLEVARVDALQAVVRARRDAYDEVLAHQEAVLAYHPVGYEDVLRVSLMRDLLSDRLADLDVERAEQLLALRSLTGIETPFAVAASLDVLPAAAYRDLDAAALLEAALARSPSLDALRARAEAFAARARVAADEALPMPALSVAWSVVTPYEQPLPGTGDGGRDALMVGLSLPLPLFGRQYDEREASLLAREDAVADDRAALVRRLDEGLRDALLRIAEEGARVERYDRDLVPTAESISEHYLIELEQGRAEHTEYLLAVEQELGLQSEVVRARAAIAAELLRIDWLTAGYLSARAAAAEASDSDRVGAEEGGTP